jgi:hypothetical protein
MPMSDGRGPGSGMKLWRPLLSALLAASTAAGWLAAACAGSPAENLYQGLLHSKLESVPAGMSVTIEDLPLGGAAGLVGAVRISFPGSDPRAQITYYVFNTSSDAVTYDNQHLSLPPQAGKLLAYPPMAHCADKAEGGYCDMIVQDDSIVITTTTSAPMDRGSGPMMGLAFQHLTQVVNASYQPPAAPVVGGLSACDLASAAEVATAIGAATGSPQSDQVGGCSWMSARGGVSIQPQEGGRSKFEFDRGRTQEATAIPGIGDDAFGFQSLAGFVQINLLRGEHYVVIILQSEGSNDRMQSATALAASVAARM